MPGAPKQQSHRALVASAVLFFLVGLVIVGWNISLPLIAYSPGPVADTIDAIVVDGAETYASDGELMMLTVAGQDINIFEAVVAAADPSVDVIARQLVRRPEESDEDYRRRNLQLMDQSTATAISVALGEVDTSAYDPAVYITGYAADTPAGEVLEIGDKIVSLGGRPIDATTDLGEAMEGKVPGDAINIAVEREGEVVEFEIGLAPQSENPAEPMIGIFVRELPFWVDIDSGIVGGPSAGTMYTLAIIDVLTPGPLTKGHVVAGTGTVDAEGNVGNIGGVRQKVVAAEAAGAEYMLVPAGNYDAALTAPRDDLELVPVATIDEALAFFDSLEPATGG